MWLRAAVGLACRLSARRRAPLCLSHPRRARNQGLGVVRSSNKSDTLVSGHSAHATATSRGDAGVWPVIMRLSGRRRKPQRWRTSFVFSAFNAFGRAHHIAIGARASARSSGRCPASLIDLLVINLIGFLSEGSLVPGRVRLLRRTSTRLQS